MMSKTVTIVDYRIGNLFSVARAIEAVGAKPVFASRYAEVRDAERLLLPGVGAFEACAAGLRETGLADGVKAFVQTGRPFLGICVGMQLLFDYSLEFGRHEGLGLIPGHVGPIPSQDATGSRKVPHIGWSRFLLPETRDNWQDTALADMPPEASDHLVEIHAHRLRILRPFVQLLPRRRWVAVGERGLSRVQGLCGRPARQYDSFPVPS